LSSEEEATSGNFPSAFHQELPKSFYPQDITRFSSMSKLKDDFDHRYYKLKESFEKERKELKNSPYFSPENLAAMKIKHKKAEEAFRQKYQKLKSDLEAYEKEALESESKGLR
jgi:hypothetical protein